MDIAEQQNHARQSSFYWPMQLLSAPRRKALAAIYIFCKEVDSIADGDLPPERKRELLIAKRQALHSKQGLTPELADAMQRYDLPAALLDDIIEGMLMDVDHQPLQTEEELERYCYHVAGAVGLVMIRILGLNSNQSATLAKEFGQCLQRINILRDIAEDAAHGRRYLPANRLAAFNLSAEITRLKENPAQARDLCRAITQEVIARLNACNASMLHEERWKLLPAFCMVSMYLSWLRHMIRDGFAYQKTYRLSPLTKCGAMLRGFIWSARARISG